MVMQAFAYLKHMPLKPQLGATHLMQPRCIKEMLRSGNGLVFGTVKNFFRNARRCRAV